MTIIASPGKVAYTLDEVAGVLGVSRATVNRLIRAGELRVSRLGWRTVRVTHEALMDYLRSKEERSREGVTPAKSTAPARRRGRQSRNGA